MSDTPHKVLTPDAGYVYYRRVQAAEAELAAAQAELKHAQMRLGKMHERIAELEESRALLATECREWREEAMAAREKEEK